MRISRQVLQRTGSHLDEKEQAGLVHHTALTM